MFRRRTSKSAMMNIFMSAVLSMAAILLLYFAQILPLHDKLLLEKPPPSLIEIHKIKFFRNVSEPKRLIPGSCRPWKCNVPESVKTQIPGYIHHIYKDKYIPMKYKFLMDKCHALNSKWKFIFWTDESVAEFVRKHFSTSIRQTFFSFSDSAERSHLSRLLIIYILGGVYLDMDMECQQPLEKALSAGNCLLDRKLPLESKIIHNRENVVMSNVIACQPKHPFFTFIIDQIEKSVYTLDVRNPLFLTDLWEKYTTSKMEENLANSVQLAEPGLFSPLISDMKGIEAVCGQTLVVDANRIHGCREWFTIRQDGGGTESENSNLIHRYYKFDSNTFDNRHTLNSCAFFPHMLICN